jgi:SAM-dependent methyltransferase
MKPRHYYNQRPEPMGGMREYIHQAVSLLEQQARVLDVGAGGGGAAVLMHRMLDTEVYCVDIAQQNVETCESLGFPAYVVDIENEPLPFSDSHFDAVVFLEVIEHLFDPYGALFEIRRVLRPTGKLIVSTHNALNVVRRLAFLLGRVNPTSDVSHKEMGSHIRLYSHAILARVLGRCGFEISRDASYFRVPRTSLTIRPPVLKSLLSQVILLEALPADRANAPPDPTGASTGCAS